MKSFCCQGQYAAYHRDRHQYRDALCWHPMIVSCNWRFAFAAVFAIGRRCRDPCVASAFAGLLPHGAVLRLICASRFGVMTVF